MADATAEAAASHVSLSSRLSTSRAAHTASRFAQPRRPRTAHVVPETNQVDDSASFYGQLWREEAPNRPRPQWSRIPVVSNFRNEPGHCHDKYDRPQTAPNNRRCSVAPSPPEVSDYLPADQDVSEKAPQQPGTKNQQCELSLKVRFRPTKGGRPTGLGDPAGGQDDTAGQARPRNAKLTNYFCMDEQEQEEQQQIARVNRATSAPAVGRTGVNKDSRVEEYLKRLEALHKQRLSGRVEDQAFCRPQKRHFPRKTTSYIFEQPLGVPDEANKRCYEFVSHEGMTLKSRRYFPQKNTTLIHFV